MATYISLNNLARYDLKAKARAESLYADASAACWQKTEKAGAVTCVPAPETPLEPVVEFLFKEIPPASGDKSPSNPSTITGVSSVKVARANSNLIRWPYYRPSGYETSDVTWTINNDGSVSATGTSDGVSTFALQNTGNIQQDGIFLQSGTYELSGCPADGSYSKWGLHLAFSSADSDKISYASDYGSGSIITVTSPLKVCFYLRVASGNTVSNLTFYPALQLIEVPFEKNEQNTYTINLGSTFYGGTLDVASGRLTVTHRMVEPSSGTVDISDRPALLPLEYTDTYGRTVTSDGNTLSVGSSGGQIVYRLANPYTVQIDPTPIDSLPALDKTSPRVNTIYTDAESVQVGYAEHPAYTEELINNAILALGGNI